jgi:hypothetical protein
MFAFECVLMWLWGWCFLQEQLQRDGRYGFVIEHGECVGQPAIL